MRIISFIALLSLIVTSGIAHSHASSHDPVQQAIQLIFKGDINEAAAWIDSVSANPQTPPSTLTALFKLRGEICKIEGNIESMLHYWNQSIAISSELYPPGDFRRVWNYALLSNYHYEMMNTLQAKIYADSCLSLIENLTPREQKQIEVHRIWDIIAQSTKQHAVLSGNYNHKAWIETYDEVFGMYEKSIALQKDQNTHKHHLAKTYHLFGNACLDLCSNVRNTDSLIDLREKLFNKANRYYELAIDIWQELYGDVHYELGKTRFVLAMLQHRVRQDDHPGNYEEIFNFYNDALYAFGITIPAEETQLLVVPNKVNLLMCLRLYSIAVLQKQEADGAPEMLEKAEKINHTAVTLWKIIHDEFGARNQNMTLSLYHMVPFEYTVKIEFLRYKPGNISALNRIFETNQYLKYFDLLHKSSDRSSWPETVSISSVQQKLDDNEWFIDFHDCDRKVQFALVIGRDTAYLYDLPVDLKNDVQNLTTRIRELEANQFSTLSNQLFNDLFGGLSEWADKRLIICPHGFINQLPFEALLVTPPGEGQYDFRSFDYLLNHCEIEYALSAATFRKKTEPLPLSVAVFAPDYARNPSFSELPFSQKLAQNLVYKGYARDTPGSIFNAAEILETSLSVLHVSGHGLIKPGMSEFSSLVLAEEHLYLDDVYAHETNATLVVLNTCNSSLGSVITQDGIHGFSRAFLSSGALAVLSNLWDVDDRSSNLILEYFYDMLAEGLSTTSAIRSAQLKHIRTAKTARHAAPYYWAGHRLLGERLYFLPARPTQTSFEWRNAAIFSIIAIAVLLATRQVMRMRNEG